jgi:Lrp/AsnC family transcriptional regulator for asnA, asnC and gidA
VDYEITRLLQQNGRIPNTEIAKKLNVSEATVRNRLQKLIKEGQMQVVAIVNPLNNRSGILGNVKIKAENAKLDKVGAALEALEGLWYIAQLSGATDFDLEFFVDSQKEFGKLINRINRIDGVVNVETSLTVRFLKNNWRFGIPGN